MEIFSIRPAREADHDAIVACVQAAYEKYIVRISKKPAPLLADYHALIDEGITSVVTNQAEEICGVLVMFPQESGMFVENVAVDPRYQGHGLGRMLMSFVEQQARSRHLTAIRLYTNELMIENLTFYHRLGFVEEGRRVDDGYRRVFLRKEIDQIP